MVRSSTVTCRSSWPRAWRTGSWRRAVDLVRGRGWPRSGCRTRVPAPPSASTSTSVPRTSAIRSGVNWIAEGEVEGVQTAGPASSCRSRARPPGTWPPANRAARTSITSSCPTMALCTSAFTLSCTRGSGRPPRARHRIVCRRHGVVLGSGHPRRCAGVGSSADHAAPRLRSSSEAPLGAGARRHGLGGARRGVLGLGRTRSWVPWCVPGRAALDAVGDRTPRSRLATARDFFCSEGPPRPLASGLGRLPKPIRRSRLTGGRRSRREGCTPPRDSCSSSSSSTSSSSSISASSGAGACSGLDHSEAVGLRPEPLDEPAPVVVAEGSGSLARGLESCRGASPWVSCRAWGASRAPWRVAPDRRVPPVRSSRWRSSWPQRSVPAPCCPCCPSRAR